MKMSKSLQDAKPELAAELRTVYNTRCRINNGHMVRLKLTMKLPGYTGWSEQEMLASNTECAAHRCVEEASDTDCTEHTDSSGDLPGMREADVMGDDLDDTGKDELVRIGQFMEDLETVEAGEDTSDDIPYNRHGVPLHMISTFRL
jgi:hypothetical protein